MFERISDRKDFVDSNEQLGLISQRIKFSVEFLANEIGERNLYHPGALLKSAEFIERSFHGLGYHFEKDSFVVPRKPDPLLAGQIASNLIFEKRGSEKPAEIIVVLAHYDTAPNSPGANDNASSVAVQIELGRALMEKEHSRTIRLVFPTNEEPPFTYEPSMGSRVYAAECMRRGDKINMAIALDSLGYHTDAEGSQKAPSGGSVVTVGTGNRIHFVSDANHLLALKRAASIFREASGIPTAVFASKILYPEHLLWIYQLEAQDVARSDNASFVDAGYRGILLTDTAEFRDPNYHKPSDLPSNLNFESLALIVKGVTKMVEDFAKE